MATQNPGFWLSRNAGTDIVTPVASETVIWDTAAASFKFYTGTVFSGVGIYDRVVGNPAVDIVSSNTATDIYSKSIPGGALGASGLLRVSFQGDIANSTGSPHNVTISVTFGGTGIATATGIAIAANATPPRAGVFGLVQMANLGVTNAQDTSGRLNITNTSASSGVLTAEQQTLSSWGLTTLDTTVAQTLKVTVTLDTNNANYEFRAFVIVVEIFARP